MATHLLARSLFLCRPTTTTTKTLIISLLSRSFSSLPTPPSVSLFRSLRPLSSAANFAFSSSNVSRAITTRSFATRTTTSSLNDQSPNWSNRPPKETILLDGCDFEHWLVVMEPPEGDPTRDEIIDSYIKTLATVVGSEQEARMKIYSVSTRCYYAFGALVSEDLSYKIKELPRVRWVLPDSYLDVKNKDYGGEPFINGQAVPYDPKYHEEWIKNNARATERNRRNDRPRNFDRSRNYERRRENMQNRDFQNTRATPMSNQGMDNMSGPGGPPNMGGMPPNNMGGMPPMSNNMPSNMGGAPPNMGGAPPNMGGMPPNNWGGRPPMSNNMPNNMGGAPPNMGGAPPNMGGMPPNNRGGMPPVSNNMPNNMVGAPPNMGGMSPNNMGGMPPSQGWSNNMGEIPPNNMVGVPPNSGWSNNLPGNMQQNFQNGPNNGGVPYQGAPSNYQNNYNRDGSMPGRS